MSTIRSQIENQLSIAKKSRELSEYMKCIISVMEQLRNEVEVLTEAEIEVFCKYDFLCGNFIPAFDEMAHKLYQISYFLQDDVDNQYMTEPVHWDI